MLYSWPQFGAHLKRAENRPQWPFTCKIFSVVHRFDGPKMWWSLKTPQLFAFCWPLSGFFSGDFLSGFFSVKFWKNFLHNSKKRISRINLTYSWNIGSYSSPWGPARRGCADAAAGLTAGWTLCRNRAGSTCTGVRLKGRHSLIPLFSQSTEKKAKLATAKKTGQCVQQS